MRPLLHVSCAVQTRTLRRGTEQCEPASNLVDLQGDAVIVCECELSVDNPTAPRTRAGVLNKYLGRFGALWGLSGVVAQLSFATYRMFWIMVDAFDYPFSWWHWALLLGNTAFMAHAEGYRGFQKAFSPRVAARARVIFERPSLARVALAPLFCMGYFEATRTRIISTYALTLGIVILVVVFHALPQPLRGVLDAGIVVGLTWGNASVIAFAFKAFSSAPFDHSPELPEPV